MTMFWHARTVVLLLATCLACMPDAESQAAYAWQDVGIGNPALTGNHTWDKQSLTITGTGAGLNVGSADQCQFVTLTRPAGDFEVVARLKEFTGEGDSAAGILVRQDRSSNACMTAFFYKSKQQELGWITRVPGFSTQAPPHVLAAGGLIARKPPKWLKLVRVGRNFAVYKSGDGRLWTQVSNVSGGPIAIEGKFELGFFVAGATSGIPVTATFDSIQIGPPAMRYQTGWVGNTFGSRAEDKHVSNGLSAMWVASDGTCYTSSYWDETGSPVTSYRDGQVARPLPVGTPQTSMGGITGDDRYVYVAAVDHIVRLDPAAPDFAPVALTLAVNLLDKKNNHSVVSGLASSGQELFVADARDNCIRVVKSQARIYYLASNTHVEWTTNIVDTTGVVHAAPAQVYQSQRVNDYNPYVIPGLKAAGVYSVRCHFADYTDDTPGGKSGKLCIYIHVHGAAPVVSFDVAAAAGGKRRPAVIDIPGGKADTNGNLTVIFERGAEGDGRIAICGIEVFDPHGTRAFALNCGGPAIDGFQGESNEIPERLFPFERPGPMAADKRGDLWIIQRGNEFPSGGGFTAKHKAAVKCYRTDGTFTGREIVDVVNPRALGYDAARDQLLVAENGPDLNVRFYCGLDARPTLTRTFGEPGGIYGGKHPGLVNDPAAGGYARFAGIAGVGVDAKGNLYVGGGFQGSDLRMFTAAGRFGWMLNSLVFCNTYDVDPASDGTELYGTYTHVRLDLSRTQPGSEQNYVGYNWDSRRYGEPVRAGGSQSIVRRLGPDKRLVLFSTGQGDIGDINIYRYEGEIAIPAGGTREQGTALWIDANGNGRTEPDEQVRMASAIGHIGSVCIDSKGDLWIANSPGEGSFMRHFFFKGLNASSVPLYSGVKGEGYEDVRFPEEGDTVNTWGMKSKLDYDADRDILVAWYPAVARKGENDRSPAQYFMARYDNWSKGNRTPRWKVRNLDPLTDPDYFMYEVNPFPYRGHMGMQIAGDYVFIAYIFGEVHVFDLSTGKLAEILSVGPEVNGQCAWEDATMGLRAFQRRNGEYLIFTENSGWGGKNNFFRWRP